MKFKKFTYHIQLKNLYSFLFFEEELWRFVGSYLHTPCARKVLRRMPLQLEHIE